MDGTIQPLPGDRIPPDPKRRGGARKRAKGDEREKPFDLAPAPRAEPPASSDAAPHPGSAHEDGVGARLDVTA